MTVSKEKALELIRKKINEFENLSERATYENRYDDEYHRVYYGTKALIEQLFSDKEVKEFSNAVNLGFAIGGGRIDYQQELNDYRVHIKKCISQLRVFEERITNFWVVGTEKAKEKIQAYSEKKLSKLITE